MSLARWSLSVSLAAAGFSTAAAGMSASQGVASHESSPLPLAEYLARTAAEGLLDNRAFVPGASARPALGTFEGELRTSEAPMRTLPEDIGAHSVLGKDPQIFPAFRVAFITVDSDLVPVTQDLILSGSLPGGHSYWDVLVQPGRIWSQAGDGGWSRAAFPFELINAREGETHNGIATFLFRGQKVSALRYQIVQQTLPGNVEVLFNAFGRAPLEVDARRVASAAAVAEEYRAARADAIAVHPWSELEGRVGSQTLSGFSDAIPARDTVLSGLDYQGTFYLHDCDTAAGPMPWCDRARFGVWSVTKAFLNEAALLRLAQKYGPSVFQEKIVDHVPAARGYPAWARVTFDDAINMATGLGNGSTRREPNAIEDGYLDPTYDEWYRATSREQKIAVALRTAKVYPWGPGQVARYRDQDMFLLGAAMDAFVKTKEGPSASLWSLLQQEVYRPIGIHYATTSRTLEPSGDGIPPVSFGLFASIDELVKVARLYQADGRWNGVQILYAPRIAQLKAGTAARGLPTGDHSPFGETTYFNTFWQIRYDALEGCKLYVPQMLGWGGNIVALYPGGVTGIRLAHVPANAPSIDDPTPMARVANRLARFCP